MPLSLIKTCDRIDGSVRAACRGVLYVTTVLLFLILSINVFLRYLWGSSLQSAGEAPELMFPWMVMAGVVLAAQHGAHISIVWFVEQVPPAARRVIGLLNCAILVVGYSVLAYGTTTLLPVVHSEHSHVLGVPSSVTYACMLVGFVFLVITTLTQAARMLAGATVDASGLTGATGSTASQREGAVSVPSVPSAPSVPSVP